MKRFREYYFFKKLVPWLFTAVFLSIGWPVAPVWCKPEVEIDPVVVTANKRESLAHEISGSISISDIEFLEDHQVTDTGEMARFIPNLFYKEAASGDAFVSRGISTMDTSLFSPMGLYVDDIALPLSHMQSQHLFDVERVEILRGPQSTLYGKNSSSGVINEVLVKPDNEIQARAMVGAGNYNTWTGGAMVSGPVKKDRLFYGLSVSESRSDGYLENQLTGFDKAGDDEHLAARGTLRWTPSERMDLSFVLDGTDRDSGLGDLRFENGPFATQRFKVYSNIDDRSEQDSLGQSLHWNYRFSSAELISITSHRRFNRTFKMDFDRTPVALGHAHVDLEQDSWSQEFRLTSTADSTWSWLTGLYAGRETLDNTWALNHVNPGIANQRISDSKSDSIALFGQSTLALADVLDATAGLRLDHSSASGAQAYVRNSGTSSYVADLSDTKVLPMAALSCEIAKGIRGYALFSTGWLAGGYDYYCATSRDSFSYKPEYTRNYEAGVKTAFFNNRLKADFSLFYTDIEDKQVKEEVPGAGIGVWKITNAADAHTMGAELEIKALPTANLEFFAGMGYARAEIDDWTGTLGGNPVDYSGKRLPWAPDLTVNAGLGYYANNGWYGTADVFCAGKQYFDAANTLEDSGYILVNLKTGYRFGRFDLSIWCKNIFDQAYARKKVANNMGHTMVEDGAPRTFGLSMNWRF